MKLCTSTSWVLNGCKAALQRSSDCFLTMSWSWTNNAPLWQRLQISLATWGKVSVSSSREVIFTLYSVYLRSYLECWVQFACIHETRIYWSEISEGPQWSREGSGILIYVHMCCVCVWWKQTKKKEQDFLVVLSVRTNSNEHKFKHIKFHLHIRKIYFIVMRGCWNTVTGCSEKLQSLHS